MINGQTQRVGGALVACPPKTETALRSIALDTGTIAALRRHRGRQQAELARLGADGGGYVFTDQRGAPIAPDTLTRTFNKLVAASGQGTASPWPHPGPTTREDIPRIRRMPR